MKPTRLFLLALALAVLAAWTQTAEAAKKKKKEPGAEGVQGTVASIDPEAKTFNLQIGKKKKGQVMTVKFDTLTQFFRKGDDGNTEKVKSSDLAARQSVAVVMDPKDASYATKVTIVPPEK